MPISANKTVGLSVWTCDFILLGLIFKTTRGCFSSSHWYQQALTNTAPCFILSQDCFLPAKGHSCKYIVLLMCVFVLLVGYQRELTYKHDDGSYSAFGKSDESGNTWSVNLPQMFLTGCCLGFKQ